MNRDAQRMLDTSEAHLDKANYYTDTSWMYLLIAILWEEYDEDPFEMGFESKMPV